MDWLYKFLGTEELTVETTLLRLFVSLLLGAIVGIERQHRKQSAGFRTFSMITTGTTLMMLVSIRLGVNYGGDVGRIAAQVVSGIGFLGAGAIIQSSGTIRGMTTASSIWAMSAVGLGVGAGMYVEAVFGTMVILFILVNLERFEKRTRIEWQPRRLVMEFDGLEVDERSILAILKLHEIESQLLGVTQNMELRHSSMTLHVYVKLQTDYLHLISELRSVSHVTLVKLEA